MIAPAWTPPPEGLRAAWARDPRLRVEGFLEPGRAEALLEALRALPHHLAAPGPTRLRYQLAVAEHHPGPGEVGGWVGWWLDEGRRWVEALTGQALCPPPDGVVSTLYTRGCYLDAHNDQGPGRAVAFVLGLSPEPWPAEEGGWLEFLTPEGPDQAQSLRHPPGFNTLDLFDVRGPGALHRIPMLLTHRERRVISGWFHRA